ncbi:MAG: DNA repair protein RadA [Clostridia bacterium]|nr:DNA repair protein RadA [Clostridia bacterium]
MSAKKATIIYRCSECGYETTHWQGKCPDCGSWNTFEEYERPAVSDVKAKAKPAVSSYSGQAKKLKDIAAKNNPRILTGINEFDSVLGGGIVPGSVVLAGGEPGIGKSTLFIQAADLLSELGKVLYVSGEESERQVKLRADRLGLGGDVYFLAETDLDEILSAMASIKPEFVIIDSIQTMHTSVSASSQGSVTQIRECTRQLSSFAKQEGTAVFLIGHVTKEGNIAGPRVLEHMVDTVLYFEGERQSSFRILRAVKNRFGSTDEIGVFEMSDTGMREVSNPSEIMLGNRQNPVPGACVYCALEGNRPVLVEIEALVTKSSFAAPRRSATGIDINRANLIIAVLEKKVGIPLFDQDIFLNVSGGMRLSEPAMDAAVAAAILSSFRNKAPLPNTVILGEISLTGEMRHISQINKRVTEATRMGLNRILIPAANYKGIEKNPSANIIAKRTLVEVLSDVFNP